MKKFRKIGRTLNKHIPATRKWRFKYWDVQTERYMKMAENVETNPHAVVFEAFGGRSFACSPRAIYKAMCADHRFDDWDFYWSFTSQRAKRQRLDLAISSRSTVVSRGSEAYFDAIASSKYWVVNNRVPEYVVPREDQVYVQCWHGTPLKRLGYDVPADSSGGALNTAEELAKRFNVDSDKWTYLLSPSPFTSKHLASAFGLSEGRIADTIIEEGYPRNDFIVNTCNAPDSVGRINALKERYGIPMDKKALLFAPTWRDDQYEPGVGYTMDSLIDFDKLRDALGDEWVVILRTHYYIANKIDLTPWRGFVYNASKVEDINHLYCMADALCTDYSSVFFDYANTGRPLYFYWPDFDHYANELHGFYFDARTIPGPKCTTPEELIDALHKFDTWDAEYGEAYEEFKQEFCPKDDGEAAKRVIDRIFEDSQRA